MVMWPDGHAHSLLENMLPIDVRPATALVAPQPVMITATDGMPIHAQLFMPKDLKAGEKRPALIFFHGGSRRQMLLGWHYILLLPQRLRDESVAREPGLHRALGELPQRHRLRPGVPRSAQLRRDGRRRVQRRDGRGAVSEESAPMSIRRASASGADPYGGYLTAMGLARASDLFAAGVDFHGVHDWNQGIKHVRARLQRARRSRLLAARRSQPRRWRSVDTWKSPVLLIHGDDDRNVSFIESINLITALRKRNVDVEQLVFPDEVHDFLRHGTGCAATRRPRISCSASCVIAREASTQ